MDQSYVDDGMSSDIHIIIIDLWLELLPHTHANNVHCLYIYIYTNINIESQNKSQNTWVLSRAATVNFHSILHFILHSLQLITIILVIETKNQ